MRKEIKRLTTAQFAKLHEVNKRTLHYYDEIGLFRPLTKAENGYRYYDISQSIDFEYIRMLKELNMSIEEIETYRKKPTPANFLKIVNEKEKEIDKQIQKLKDIKTVMQRKKAKIAFVKLCKSRKSELKNANQKGFSSILMISQKMIYQKFFPLERYMGNRTNTHGNGKFYFA